MASYGAWPPYHEAMLSPALPTPDDACYLALKTRDARFDGRFFTGVTSTGIYCRPVCGVKTPRRDNCRFFAHAAQAEGAGFRPCLRCRPELAPQAHAWSSQDAGAILAQQAARLLDEPDAWGHEAPSVQALARRLGVSDRHVRRIFEAQFGVSPLQYLQTRRLLTAKQLLTDTALPVSQVALASGFASLRRFNAAFAAHYRLQPTALRKTGAAPRGDTGLVLKLAYRPPYDSAAMLGFLGQRGLTGVEQVEGLRYRRTLRLHSGGREHSGWLAAHFTGGQLALQVSDGLHDALPAVVRRVRALLDLDADLAAINAVLHGPFPGGDGLRVPGTACGFELAVRAVLGQQVTVAAGRTLTQRLVARFGEPITTPFDGLDRLFPSAVTLAGLDTNGSDALGQLGIVRQRQAAIVALARAVASGTLALHGGADVPATTAALRALPGIGDWTAQYIAMRALRWPDAFPAGDVALHKALGVAGAREAERASAAWTPWRSYAVLRAWAGTHAAPPNAAEPIANFAAQKLATGTPP